MQSEMFLEVNNIKNMINSKFPLQNISAYEESNDVVISINNREIYYSDNYQELISEININYLWPKNIMNVIFIYSEDKIYRPSIYYARELMIKDIAYQWSYKQTPVNLHNNIEISRELLEAA
jgi:hypothetical protein